MGTCSRSSGRAYPAYLPYAVFGRYAEAVACADRAIEICEKYGFDARIGNVLLHRGPALFDLGDEERGLADIQRGVAFWRKTSGMFMLARNMAILAEYQLRAKHLEQARASLSEAERLAETTEEKDQLAEIIRLRGRIWQSEGNHEQARLCFRAGNRAVTRSAGTPVRTARRPRPCSGSAPKQAARLRRLRSCAAVVDWFPASLECSCSRRMPRTAAIGGLSLEGFEILAMFPVRDVRLEAADFVTTDGYVVVDELVPQRFPEHG